MEGHEQLQPDLEFRGLGFTCRLMSYPFLVYLVFYIADPNHKTRYPEEGVGYEPLGRVSIHIPHQSELNHATPPATPSEPARDNVISRWGPRTISGSAFRLSTAQGSYRHTFTNCEPT